MNLLRDATNKNDIVYFTLKQPMPGVAVGSMVSIIDRDGEHCLRVENIELPIEFAKKYPEWFQPVTLDEHEKLTKQNTIKWLIEEKGRSVEEAELLYLKL